MAKTVDEVTLKINVEGQSSIDQASASINKIEQNTKSASDQLKAFNVRNVAYQVQDLAVQLSMGTNAFVALGQQLPQLLGGFGTAGAVIGAVAAVAIPLLQKGLETLGYDFRSLNQRLSDLGTASQGFIQAQQANLASVQGLSGAFGGLASVSKEFFQLQESFAKQKALLELNSGVTELQGNLKNLNPDVAKMRDSLGIFSGPVEGVVRLQQAFKLFQLGLTASQAEELSKKIRQIDPTNPEKTAVQITSLLATLTAAGVPADKLRNVFEQIVEPALKIGNASLDLKKNIKAAGEEASALQVALLGIQNKYQPDINASRRNFDQIKAIKLEGEQKIAEFVLQANEKTAKDGVNRSREIATFRLRTEQDVKDKIKDVQKQQEETTRSAILTADTKLRQVEIEKTILSLNEEGKLSAYNAYQYNSDVLNLYAEQQNQLISIDEQLRKNLITQAQANELQAKAAQILEQGLIKAYAAAEARQRAYIQGLERANELDKRKLENFNATAGLSDRERQNAQQLFDIETERLTQLKGLQSIVVPEERTKREQEINNIYDKRIASIKTQQDANKALTENFSAGWSRALANYSENSRNAFENAKNIFDKVTKGMEDSIVKFARTGKFEFKSFLADITEEILRSNIRKLMTNLFETSPGSSGATSGGLLGNVFGSLLGFANGGIIPTNAPVLVGERGPELLMNASGMNVIPNQSIGSSTNVTYNISAVDAMSFKAMIARDPSFIHAVASQGAKGTPARR